MLLDGGQQCGPVRISNLSWVKVILWVQELHMHRVAAFKNKLIVSFHFLAVAPISQAVEAHKQRQRLGYILMHPGCITLISQSLTTSS